MWCLLPGNKNEGQDCDLNGMQVMIRNYAKLGAATQPLVPTLRDLLKTYRRSDGLGFCWIKVFGAIHLLGGGDDALLNGRLAAGTMSGKHID